MHPQTIVPKTNVQPQALANATLDVAGTDTAGFAYAQGVFTVGATTGNITVLKVQESDASGSGWADISGASFSGADLPGATDDNNTWIFNIDLGGRKRYLRFVATEDNTGSGLVHGVFNLSRAENGATSATEYGAAAVVNVP